MSRAASLACAMASGLFCLPTLLYGGCLLALWVTIQIRHCVYLEYPYLAGGVAFGSLGVVALLCVVWGTRKRGYWRALLLVPVVIGLWAMMVIPNVFPSDFKSASHVLDIAQELDSFGDEHGYFPIDEAKLKQGVPASTVSGPYRKDGQQLAFRVAFAANAAGPILHAGEEPGVTFYALSGDHKDVWLTATELGSKLPVGGHARLIDFLSVSGLHKVVHLHVGQRPSEE
jgi:hypothetical protein